MKGSIAMKKKVSLTELVANKIVYAVILASYYWMWARSDWQDWYPALQSVLGSVFLFFFAIQAVRRFKYKQEACDELAEQNLRRCNSVCLDLFVSAMILLAWVCAIFGHTATLDAALIGWVIILSILALTVIRTVLFIVMDRKGV